MNKKETALGKKLGQVSFLQQNREKIKMKIHYAITYFAVFKMYFLELTFMKFVSSFWQRMGDQRHSYFNLEVFCKEGKGKESC